MTNPGVLITGGASGIGQETAKRFIQQRRPVYVLSRDARRSSAELDAVAQESGSPAPLFLGADVTDRDSLEAAKDELERAGHSVAIVIASAGVNVRRATLELADSDLRAMLDTNLYGVIATFQVFAPLVLRNSWSRFIAIGSVSGAYGMNLRATYGATKSGVSGLVRALSVEWAPKGATVNAIAPGVIDTSLTRGYMEQFPERAEALIENTHVGRLGTVDDVANVAVFLASEQTGFLTGQTIVVDGGLSSGCSWW